MIDRVSRGFFSVCFQIIFLNLLCFVGIKCGQRPSSRVAFVGWAFLSMSHGSYPDFLPSFFPYCFFFSGRFFSGLRSDSILCIRVSQLCSSLSTTCLNVIEVVK